MNDLEKLTHDVAEMIAKYIDYRNIASTNRTAYETCEDLMGKLHYLSYFAKRYLGYEIEITTTHDGNQYKPENILGFSIIEAESEG